MEHTPKDPIEIARKIAAQEKRNKEKALKKEAEAFHVSKTLKEKAKEEKMSEAEKYKERIEALLKEIKKTIEEQKEVKNSVRKTISDLEKEGLGGVLKSRESVRKIFHDPMKEYDTLRKIKKSNKIAHKNTEDELNPKIQEIEKEIQVLESQINQESEFFKKSEAEPFLNEVIVREELKKEFIDARRSINISEFASQAEGFYQALIVVNELENIAKKKRIDSSFIPETAREILHEKIETFVEAEKAKSPVLFNKMREKVENLAGLNERYLLYQKEIEDLIQRRHEIFEEVKPLLEKYPYIGKAISEYGIRVNMNNEKFPEDGEKFLQHFAVPYHEYYPEEIVKKVNVYQNGGSEKFIREGYAPIKEKALKKYMEGLKESLEKMRELILDFSNKDEPDVQRKIQDRLSETQMKINIDVVLGSEYLDQTVLNFIKNEAKGDLHKAQELIKEEEANFEEKKLDLEAKADVFVDKAIAINKERALKQQLGFSSDLKTEKKLFDAIKEDIIKMEHYIDNLRRKYAENLNLNIGNNLWFHEDYIRSHVLDNEIKIVSEEIHKLTNEINVLKNRELGLFESEKKHKAKIKELEDKKEKKESKEREKVSERQKHRERSNKLVNDLSFENSGYRGREIKKEFNEKIGIYALGEKVGPTLSSYLQDFEEYLKPLKNEQFGTEKAEVLEALNRAEAELDRLYKPKTA